MRLLALLVIVLGIAVLVFGIILIPQASNGRQEVKDSLSTGVTLDNLDDTYDLIDGQLSQVPNTDPQYLMLFAQRTSLGLARANVGTARMVQINGIVDILIGVALISGGCALVMRRNQNV
jgi:uncharacterized membrane protein HdeD (DUF308 family)